jgi:DNA repair exonuclease SbcCD ATPase subunit
MTRSPERQRLHDAIARVAEIEAAIAALGAAREKLGQAWALESNLREAERELLGAQATEPSRIAAEALGRPWGGLSVADAQKRLDELQAEVERRRAGHRLLDQEIASLNQRLEGGRRVRDDAVRVVLAADPTVAEMRGRYEIARQQWADLRAVLAMALQPVARPQPTDPLPADGFAGPMRAAVEQLGRDADALLPTV